MQHFFADPSCVDGEQIRLAGSDVNHMKNVLRMKPGEEVWVSDGEGMDYFCSVEGYEEKEAVLRVVKKEVSQTELASRLILFQGLPKGDKMEWIVQKAVELGAYSVVPVSTRRCVVKLDNKKAEKKVSRWQQIAESAAKQSKRMLVPEVRSVMTFKEALAYAKELDVLLIPYELAKGMKETKELIRSIEPGKSIGVFIGPEGGFEEQEVADAMEAGAKPITLGHRILRTETAGLAVLSVLMFQLEDE